jgi:hypothetical protein
MQQNHFFYANKISFICETMRRSLKSDFTALVNYYIYKLILTMSEVTQDQSLLLKHGGVIHCVA